MATPKARAVTGSAISSSGSSLSHFFFGVSVISYSLPVSSSHMYLPKKPSSSPPARSAASSTA